VKRGGRHRKDGNHDVVVEAIERRGFVWWDTSQSEIGVDGFVVGHGRLVPCEIKDPESRRGLALSENERRTHRLLGSRGVRVEILTGDNESLDVLLRVRRDPYEPR